MSDTISQRLTTFATGSIAGIIIFGVSERIHEKYSRPAPPQVIQWNQGERAIDTKLFEYSRYVIEGGSTRPTPTPVTFRVTHGTTCPVLCPENGVLWVAKWHCEDEPDAVGIRSCRCLCPAPAPPTPRMHKCYDEHAIGELNVEIDTPTGTPTLPPELRDRLLDDLLVKKANPCSNIAKQCLGCLRWLKSPEVKALLDEESP